MGFSLGLGLVHKNWSCHSVISDDAKGDEIVGIVNLDI